jgi:outer membrane protein assembly factor BamE (lipoprotein component of BamABCDE complex)
LTPTQRSLVTVLALGALVVSTTACSRIRGHQGYIADNTLIDGIQAGVDNRDSVEKTLGRPTFISQFGSQDWYYVARDTRQLAFATPSPTAQMVLRVRFNPDGSVSAVDKAGMEKVAKVKPNSDKTPTLGRDRSFLEDLFGNIGTVGGAATGAGTADNPN